MLAHDAAALPPGMGAMTVTVDKTTYSTDDVVMVTLAVDTTSNGTIPADDTMLQLVVRKCDAVIASSCSDDKYKQWKTQPFGTLAPSETSKTVMIDNTWPSSTYYVSVESTKYGKTGLASSQQYIYGMSVRFAVTYTKGNLYIREPSTQTTWKYDTPATVVWRTDGMPGGETIAVTMKDANNMMVNLGSVQQTAEGGEFMVTPVAAWGMGGITVRVALAENDAIFDDVVLNLAPPDAYYEITDPTAQTNWMGGTMVTVAWTPHNIAAGINCVVSIKEATNQDSYMLTAQPVDAMAGTVSWMVPATLAYTSNAWTVEINDNTVRSRSAKFQITSSQPPGDCQIMKLQREMNLYDQMVCTKNPVLLVAGNIRVTSITIEWLYCIDDRVRITIAILGNGGAQNVVAFKKIGADTTRIIDVVRAADYGGDVDIQLSDIRREDLGTKKALIANVGVFPYNTDEITDGPAAVMLKSGMRLEMTDPMCKCPYEDPTAPACVTAPKVCVDPMDPACQGPCVPNDSRAKCIDDPQPRDSVYNANQNLCSSGFEVNVHSTPCQPGDKQLFTIKRKSTALTLLNKRELPGCDKYWLNVRTTQGTGYVISSLVKPCQTTAPVFQTDASTMTRSLLVVAVAIVAALIV